MSNCKVCDADTYVIQEGRFRRVMCTECRKELRPNGTYAEKGKDTEALHNAIRNDITEQYADLLKDLS